MQPFNKKGQQLNLDNILKIGLAILVSVLVLQQFGINVGKGGTQAGTALAGGTGTTTVTVVDDSCDIATTTTTFLNTNILARGTAPNQFTRVFLDGTDVSGAAKRVDKGQVADAGTLTLAPKDKVIAYHAENSTADGTGYYTSKVEYTIGCTGALSDEAKLYQMDNAMTLSYKNQNGQVNTGQAVAANSKYDLDVTIRSSSQRSYGNPELKGKANNALCFQYNNTVITSMDWKVGGVNQGVVSTPQVESANNTVTGQNTFKCFTMPVIMNTEKLEGVLHIESGATAATDTNSINVTTEDMDYDLNADDLSEIVGLQDEDGNDLGFRGRYLIPIDLTA